MPRSTEKRYEIHLYTPNSKGHQVVRTRQRDATADIKMLLKDACIFYAVLSSLQALASG